MKAIQRLGLGLVCALVASLSLTAASPAVAMDDDGRSEQVATYQTIVEVTTYDDAGNVTDESRVVGPRVPVGKSTRFTPTTIHVQGQKPIRYRVFDAGMGGILDPSGCRTVHIVNNAYTTIGQIAYKFHAEANYCWNLKQLRTTYNWSNAYPSNVQGTFEYRGLISNFHNAISNGHRVFKQGKFQNCLAGHCVYTTYPSVDMKLYNNGYYGWETN